MDFCAIFWILFLFSPWACKKSGKPWNWLQIEHCWVLLSAAECCWEIPFPAFFPFVLCVFSHCFVQISLFFPQFLIDFYAIFWLRSHLFRPWPCKKSGKTPKYVADWALLRNAIPSLFPFVLLKFSWFLPWFLMGFGSFLQSFPLFFTWNCQKQSISIAFPMFSPSFWWIFALFFGFFFYFHPGPAKSQENLEIGCRLSTAECCWVLLSAAECCWVLLSATECCWVLLRNPIPSLFPFVLCVFSHCFVQISLFFPQFLMDFCAIFWLRSHLFRPWPCKKSGKTPKYVADWALLRNAIPSLFPFVLLKFSWFLPWFLMGFGSFLQSFPLFFTWNCQKTEHFNSIPNVFPQFLMDFCAIFRILFLFSPWACKKSGKPWNWLQIEHCWVLLSAAECYWVLLSAAECCWEIPFPAFFHLFCVCFPIVLSRYHCFFLNFWWIFALFFGFVLTFFGPDPAKSQEKLRNMLQIEHCWEMQSPAFFHLFCWSFLGFCHGFWWVLVKNRAFQ